MAEACGARRDILRSNGQPLELGSRDLKEVTYHQVPQFFHLSMSFHHGSALLLTSSQAMPSWCRTIGLGLRVLFQNHFKIISTVVCK